jgi:hypothetical protein
MNRKTHVFLLLLLLLFILYLCRNKIINLVEPFGNQIIIHPDGSFNPQETTFSVLTYDKDTDSGYTQVGICSDDSSWTKGDKTCRDYSLVDSNCDDIGSDGRSALNACRVACDNCIKYEQIKRRLPSPVEDTEDPPYSQFQGSMENIGIESDGVGSRETMNSLAGIDERLNLFTDAYENQANIIRELNEIIHERISARSLSQGPDSEWGNIRGKLAHISVGKDWLWGVSDDDDTEVFYCENSSERKCGVDLETSDWRLASNLSSNTSWAQLDVGETEVWAVDDGGQIYKRAADKGADRTGSGSSWAHVDGNLRHVSVGKDWIWGVNNAGSIYACENSSAADGKKCEGQPGDWLTGGTAGGSIFQQLDVGETEVWGVDNDGHVFKRKADPNAQGSAWVEVTSKGDSPTAFGDISVGEGWIWAIKQGSAPLPDSDQPIYKCKQPCDGTWELAGNRDGRGALNQIDASEGEVWGVSDDGRIFRKSIGDKNIPTCRVPVEPKDITGARRGQGESSIIMDEERSIILNNLATEKTCETDFDGTEDSCDKRCDFIPGWINPDIKYDER